ncbi:hypothetical protein GF389_02060 [Candidatus Dojkabacteria bacterium]|nr:hypothetical protein [Candidatus Dojkabacteria bacterium]
MFNTNMDMLGQKANEASQRLNNPEVNDSHPPQNPYLPLQSQQPYSPEDYSALENARAREALQHLSGIRESKVDSHKAPLDPSMIGHNAEALKERILAEEVDQKDPNAVSEKIKHEFRELVTTYSDLTKASEDFSKKQHGSKTRLAVSTAFTTFLVASAVTSAPGLGTILTGVSIVNLLGSFEAVKKEIDLNKFIKNNKTEIKGLSEKAQEDLNPILEKLKNESRLPTENELNIIQKYVYSYYSELQGIISQYSEERQRNNTGNKQANNGSTPKGLAKAA